MNRDNGFGCLELAFAVCKVKFRPNFRYSDTKVHPMFTLIADKNTEKVSLHYSDCMIFPITVCTNMKAKFKQVVGWKEKCFDWKMHGPLLCYLV